MADMNRRLEELLVQMREMLLTPAELADTVNKYADNQTQAGVLIHTAATMLSLEVAFSKPKETT